MTLIQRVIWLVWLPRLVGLLSWSCRGLKLVVEFETFVFRVVDDSGWLVGAEAVVAWAVNKKYRFYAKSPPLFEKSITMKNMEESLKRAMMLKLFIKKLKRVLLLSASRGANVCETGFDEVMEAAKIVPVDVKKGHFAVTAIKGEEPKRFVVKLDCLANPDFLSLLEQAKEEYGFQQEGVLAVPCRPEELQMILEKRRRRRASTEW
ncbi:auxin-responsive protein SAUR72-like [Populus nigra]|uniref:auxin-responsive protein SAUR72-like n=1 Tax=Populus nigra TaxID=3691 RepID=UPI002B26B1CE|nr:auxin-responsive protein SAUR72-like [Populus nigra]